VNLERIARHIGKIVDNSSIKDIAEASLTAALAYAGYQRFKGVGGALLGPVSLKLAQTPGGITSPSQIAGVLGLCTLGVAMNSDVIKDVIGEPLVDTAAMAVGVDPARVTFVMPWESCPPGFAKTSAMGYICSRKAWELQHPESK